MIEQRPIQPTPVGALRFNTDNLRLEYFDGNQYVNIMSLGNASDFGDCTARDEVLGGCSNGHGGL